MGHAIPCPFVYANGDKCAGHIDRARAYGPKGDRFTVQREDVRKYRLWCSNKGDHAGAVPSLAGKLRMEFYPRDLAAGVEDWLWSDELIWQ